VETCTADGTPFGGGEEEVGQGADPISTAVWAVGETENTMIILCIEIIEYKKVLMFFFYLPQDEISCQPMDVFVLFFVLNMIREDKDVLLLPWRRFCPLIMSAI
jgi:hypothetical protein